MFQQTISKNIKIKGKALFSGEKVQMKIMPAPVFKGIVFIVDGKEIPAKFDNIYNTENLYHFLLLMYLMMHLF